MPVQGIIITISNTSESNISITDIPDVTDEQPGFQEAGPVVIESGSEKDIFFTGAVAKSYGLGDIRTHLDSGDLTVSFHLDENVQESLTFPKFSDILTVAPEKADYTSIQEALNVATANTTVLVFSGTYSESITTVGVASGVSVVGFPCEGAVILAGSNATSVRVTVENNFSLKNVTVNAPSSGSSPAIDCTGLGSGETVNFANISIVGQGGSGNAFNGCGSGVVHVSIGMKHRGGTLGSFINVSSGDFIAESIFAEEGVSDSFINISGGNTQIRGVSFPNSTLYTGTSAIDISGGSLQLFSLSIPEELSPLSKGLVISGDGINLDLGNCHLHSTSSNIHIESGLSGSGNIIVFNGIDFKQEELLNESGNGWFSETNWIGIHTDTGIKDDPGTKVLGSFHVGNSQKTSESSFGSGGVTTNSMFVYTDDGTGTNFIDVTTEAKTKAASTFTLQGTSANAATLYVGFLVKKFVDIIINQTVVADLGTGSFILEVWDGEAWEEINFMVNDLIYPRLQQAKEAFTLLNNQVRWDLFSPSFEDWTQNDPGMGTTAYWIRFRNPDAITTVPTIEHIAIGCDRRHVNADGSLSLSGLAEEERTWWLGTGSVISAPSGGVNAPGNLDVTLSTNVTYRQPYSNYRSGQNNRAGTKVTIPVGLDTSREITFELRWVTDGTSTLDVQWELYVTLIGSDSTLNVDTEELLPVVENVTPSGTANKIISTEFLVSIPDIVPGDAIGFSLWRRGSGGDSNPDDAGVLTMSWRGYFIK